MKYTYVVLSLFLLSGSPVKGHCIFDNPLSVGVGSGLIFKKFHNVVLACAVHSYLKHEGSKPLVEEVATYFIGGMIGRYLRPEAKALLKEIRNFFRGRSKIKKAVSKVGK